MVSGTGGCKVSVTQSHKILFDPGCVINNSLF